MAERQYTQQTIQQANDLYFKIEQHFAEGGSALSMRDIKKMLGLSSSASAQMYVSILRDWGFISHEPKTVRTITLAKRDYPTVVYGTPTDHTEPLYFPRI